jgi:hypothetical protein
MYIIISAIITSLIVFILIEKKSINTVRMKTTIGIHNYQVMTIQSIYSLEDYHHSTISLSQSCPFKISNILVHMFYAK